MLKSQISSDPHLLALCITDNISAKNWIMQTSKKSIIGHALARFFCGLLIEVEGILRATLTIYWYEIVIGK
jgi:hypothetical protein